MTAPLPSAAIEREELRTLARHRNAAALRPLLDRYGSLVFLSALRRTGDAAVARDVTAAVFHVLSRRSRKLSRKTVLAGWLFNITRLACRKCSRPKLSRRYFWPWRSGAETGRGELSQELDGALDRLPARERDVLLLNLFLRADWPSVAACVRTSENRARKKWERGLARLCRFLVRRGVDSSSLVDFAAAPAAGDWTTETAENVLASWDENSPVPGRTAFIRLGRRILWTLAWARWWRRVFVGVPLVCLSVVALIATLFYLDSLSGHSRSISAFLVWSARHEARTVPGLAQPARAWPQNPTMPTLSVAAVQGRPGLYEKTNIWIACLKFTEEQWRALKPEWIGPLPNFLQPDGTVLLRHPEAQRSGLAGVLGYDFHWTRAELMFGGRRFTNVACRYKGNGTYLGSLYGEKRAFKVDLNKFTKGQRIGGSDEINFNNLVNDHSCMSDTLGYEFFRDAGVPAPRTAFAYLSVDVSGRGGPTPLGLYVMVEPVDKNFVEEWLGSPQAPLFKPVTYELFHYLGDDWAAYADIYDLKTKATPVQRERLIAFARLVGTASDAEFARQLEEFLDLEAFARFLAGQVLLSNYDSLLSTGQNYYLYLHPESNRFGFIPWDLDLAWGGFFLLGTTGERERASIWHPWVGQNRFLERVMSVPSFKKIYQARLEDFLSRLLVADRLNVRIDELAAVLRGPVTAESDFRRRKFEEALGERRSDGREDGSHNRPAHQLKRFIVKRAASVRRQLDGKTEGVILERRRQ